MAASVHEDSPALELSASEDRGKKRNGRSDGNLEKNEGTVIDAVRGRKAELILELKTQTISSKLKCNASLVGQVVVSP
jgi:hypothetical protein